MKGNALHLQGFFVAYVKYFSAHRKNWNKEVPVFLKLCTYVEADSYWGSRNTVWRKISIIVLLQCTGFNRFRCSEHLEQTLNMIPLCILVPQQLFWCPPSTFRKWRMEGGFCPAGILNSCAD